VIRTRVGYAGGEKDSPTYKNIGDHTETVQVDYDPELITYDQLLDIFWKSHKPTGWTTSRQYMKAVFYHNDQQRELALASKTALEQKNGSTVKTEVVPIRSFTMAEDYHQKFTLKNHNGLKNEMSLIYPQHQDFVYSTAVARLNGYVGRHGTKEQLMNEIESLGLSSEGKKVLTNMVRK
jgi:peptide-methionine (S)-S-oxide reductase